MAEDSTAQKASVLLVDPKETSTSLIPKIWGASRFREPLVHHVGRVQVPRRKQRTASTKGRGEVRGGGKKPWRQKGTGRARHGSIRSPLWRKGGVTFGPQPRIRSIVVNKKERKGALADVLWTRWHHGCLGLLESDSLTALRAKQGKEILQKISWKGKTLILTMPGERNLRRAFRNIPSAILAISGSVRTDQVLRSDGILASPEAWKATVKELDHVA